MSSLESMIWVTGMGSKGLVSFVFCWPILAQIAGRALIIFSWSYPCMYLYHGKQRSLSFVIHVSPESSSMMFQANVLFFSFGDQDAFSNDEFLMKCKVYLFFSYFSIMDCSSLRSRSLSLSLFVFLLGFIT